MTDDLMTPETGLRQWIEQRDLAGEQFRAYLQTLPEAPAPEHLALLHHVFAELSSPFADDVTAMEKAEPPFSAADLAELRKTEFRVFYLDFLFLLYFLEQHLAAEEPTALLEHAPQFLKKLQRMHQLMVTLQEL